MDMRLINHWNPQATMPQAPARDVAATAGPGKKVSQAAGDCLCASEGLEPALAAARDLLSTVEAVNPGTSRRELFAYVTQYRARLADLVAACPAAGSADGT